MRNVEAACLARLPLGVALFDALVMHGGAPLAVRFTLSIPCSRSTYPNFGASLHRSSQRARLHRLWHILFRSLRQLLDLAHLGLIFRLHLSMQSTSPQANRISRAFSALRSRFLGAPSFKWSCSELEEACGWCRLGRLCPLLAQRCYLYRFEALYRSPPGSPVS